MQIKNLIIKNFRNIIDCDLSANERINYLIGENAQGKTNFLESIYFINFYKSFRTNSVKDLINFKSDYLFICSSIKNDSLDNIKISLDRSNNKKILLNNNKPDSFSVYNKINSIIYYPSEINYLILYPFFRRNLIDRSIFFIEIEYLNVIKKYNKILKQRNLYLKNPYGSYCPWNDQFIKLSLFIIKKRIFYIERINKILKYLCEKEGFGENYKIKYSKYDKNIDDLFLEQLDKVENSEKKCGYSLIGPHVEDINFFINDINIKKYSSEGQKKYLLLYYKYAQMLDFKNIYNNYPILLFDDYSSELDERRRKFFFEKIIKNSGQIFMTTTKKPDEVFCDSSVFNIMNGNISIA
ncbi:MAG: hypothetical protein C0622_02680 [Desulfuromonas sp.]|nr:MAG: hypothetical protein C0622_02680 [Desulfuromonas sp.]